MDNHEENIKYFAAVIGDWHFNSLGMVRSLGENGVDVVYINLSDGGYAESSRYTKKTYHIKSEKEMVDALLDAAQEFGGKPVLFPGCDTAALYIDNSYDILKDKCICPGFRGSMAHYMDKFNMCGYAKEAGFNVPDGFVMKICDDGFEKLRNFPLPLIIKPLKSVDGIKDDIMICKNEQERENSLKWLESDGSSYEEVLIESFVEGKENLMVEYCGCKSRGEKVKVFGQLEKIREYPVNRGSTTYAVIKKDITYIDTVALDRFLEKTGFSGLFDLELKVVDGFPFFLEINYRNGAPSYGFTKAGFNVPYEWFCSQTGIDASGSCEKETTLMSERDDLNNVKDGNVGIFSWIKDIRKTDTMMLFSRDDKKPFTDAYNKIVYLLFSLLQKR